MAEMKVALTAVDGISGPVKQATASVNAFGATANTVGQQTTAAFEKMNSSVSAVVGKMTSFATAITGVAIGAFISNILQSSDAIKDLSESFGVSIEKILEVEAGFARAGRSTEQMGLAMATFEASLQEAQNGSARAQAELAKLGLSEEFRRSHTSLESFNKMMETVAGSAGDAEIKVAAVGVAGRGMKTISAADFVEGFKNAQGTLSGLAANTVLAADTQKKLEQSLKDVRNAFLNLIAPALDFLEAIIGRGGQATIIAGALGLALVGLVSSAMITGFNTLLGLFGSLAAAMGLNTAATTVAVGATNLLTTAELNYIIVKRAEFAARVAALQAIIAESNARLAEIGIVRAGTVAEAQLTAARRALLIASGQLAIAQTGLAGTTAAVTAATALGTGATATAATATGIFATATGILTGALATLGVILFRIGAAFVTVAVALAAPAWAVITAGVVAIGVAVSALIIIWRAFGNEITQAFSVAYTAVKDFGSKTLSYLSGVFDKIAAGLRKAMGLDAADLRKGKDDPRIVDPNKVIPPREAPVKKPADLKPYLAAEASLRNQFELEKFINEAALNRIQGEKNFIGESEASRNAALASFDAQVKAQTDLLKITQEIAVLEITIAQGGAEAAINNQGKLQILKQQRDIIAATRADAGILAKSSLEQAQIQAKNTNILRDAGLAARQQVDDFIHGNELITDRISLETQIMGLGRDQAQLESARADLTQRTNDKVRDLNLEMAKLKVLTAAEDPNAAAKIKFLETTEKNIIFHAELDQKFLALSLQGQQKKRTALESQLFVNDLINSAQSEAINLANEFAKLSLGTDQQKIADMKTQNSLLAQQQIVKESALLGVDAAGRQQTISLERQLQIRKEIDTASKGNLATQQAIQETTRQIERQKFLQEIKNTIATDAINLENTINKLYMSGDQQRIADIRTQNSLLAEQQILKESAALGVDTEGRQRIIGLERQQQIRNEMATKTNIDVAGQEVVQKETNQLERQKFIQDLINSAQSEAINLANEFAKLSLGTDQQKIADIKTQNSLLAQQRILKESMELGLDAQGRQQTISLERQLQIRKEIDAAGEGNLARVQAIQETTRQIERQKFLQEIKNTIATDAINLENAISKLYMSSDQQRIADIRTQNSLLAEQQILKESAALGVDKEGRQRVINLQRQQQIRNEMATKTNIDVAGQEVVQKETKQLERQKFIQDLLNSNSLSAITLQTDLAKLTMSSDQQKIADIMSQNALLAQQRILKESMDLGLDTQGRQQTIDLERQLQIKKEINSANEVLITGAQSLIDRGREFNTGWTQSFEQYRSDAENSAAQSRQYFQTFSKGAEDALVDFVRTGKLSFKDLANSLIADFVRIQAQKAITGLFGSMGGSSGGTSGGGIGSIFSAIKGMLGFAAGGMPPVGQPSVVGERGPELFVPQSAGKIIPNNALGGSSNNTVNNTAVTYSIQAVDAQSFRALLARDPEFIHNVSEQGRRSLPIRSRR